MSSEEFQQLRAAFDRVVAAPPDQREALIEQASPALAPELRPMLAAHAAGSSFLDLPPDTSFGPYRIEEELGRGGMGVVYRARRSDGAFDKQVAVKVLRHAGVDSEFLRRFHREREILGQLDHPHIAAILDSGETSAGDPYFVMEYVKGIPITTYCEALTTDQKLGLFLQVCDAVQHAHRNLTVHRDLKPGNILVTASGAVKLLDFGIAKLLPQGGPSADATAVILTPEYTSPEQIQNEPITTSADVFALGILLYRLLSGVHPFAVKGQPPHEVMRAICQNEAKLLPGELGVIVATALRKQPAWRYPSVEQLADDIGRYRRGWPVLAKGDGLAYRFRKFAQRHWLPLGAAAALVAILVGAALEIQNEAKRADQQRRVAETRTVEAESERRKEQQRYREVRALAASLLFELHDGIRDLAGSTTARRLIVAKAQRQLELLNAEPGDDIELHRDLAASYERMGQLQEHDSALAAYRHAVELRRKIAQRPDATVADKRDLALSISKLGDGQFMASKPKDALASYNAARALAEALPSPRQRTLGEIDERRCIALLATGANVEARDTCREGISLLQPLAKAAPGDVEIQRLIATTQASYANALRFSGKSAEALAQSKLAIESFTRLTALAPNNAEFRRLASSAEMIYAASLAATGDSDASLEAFRRSVQSMKVAIEIDPADLSSALRLAVTLRGFSRRLNSSGKKEAAHNAAREAIDLLEQTASKPGAGAVEWNEYADALLKADWADLKQPAKALQLARDAVAATKRENPFFLDTLAWAQYSNGSAAHAADTERDALKLLPADAKGGLHDELDRGLKTFLAGSVKEF